MEWVITDNIYNETWRRLLEFTNTELTIDEISRRHGIPKSTSQETNYRKQAKQVRAAILQAKEYFEAAKASSTYTSPNHLYYGITSLASAMMLILGDGSKSLDVLRRDSKNAHHGLKFTTSCTSTEASRGLTLLQKSFVEVLPRGHFANWYSTLPKMGTVYAYTKKHLPSITISSREIGGTYAIADINRLTITKRSAFSLLSTLPDLYTSLTRYGISISASRTTHVIEYQTNEKQNHTWSIHGTQTRDDLECLLDHFKIEVKNQDKFKYKIEDNALGGIITLDVEPNEVFHFQWPDSRETINHDSISYAKVLDTNEITDGYLIAYQLSMLSRYYPDIWVTCIESQCKAAKIIEQLVAVLQKKLPILALSNLTSSGITISTHREPWKGL